MNQLSICPQRVSDTARRIMLGRYEPMVWRDSIDAIARFKPTPKNDGDVVI